MIKLFMGLLLISFVWFVSIPWDLIGRFLVRLVHIACEWADIDPDTLKVRAWYDKRN